MALVHCNVKRRLCCPGELVQTAIGGKSYADIIATFPNFPTYGNYSGLWPTCFMNLGWVASIYMKSLWENFSKLSYDSISYFWVSLWILDVHGSPVASPSTYRQTLDKFFVVPKHQIISKSQCVA